jgi:hypothetical protein
MFLFEIVDTCLKEQFLCYQSRFGQQLRRLGIIYIPVLECSLESVLDAIEYIPLDRKFQVDQLSLAIIDYWFSHPYVIEHWIDQLSLANRGCYWDHVLICRMTHLPTFRDRLEQLMAL